MSEELFAFSKWDLRTTRSFRKHLAEYQSIPNYKKALYTMIRFEDMYKPINKGYRYVDTFGTLAATNEHRRMMRCQVYMNRRNIISTYDKNSGRRLVVTSKGHKIYYKDYPLAKIKEAGWEGTWTIVMYDIPISLNSSRDLLRSKLKSLGFGSPQHSVYINPLPLEEAIQKLIESDSVYLKYVWVLRARSVMGMDNKEIAQKSWPLDEINRLYKKLIGVLPQSKVVKNKNELIEQWRQLFLAVNAADPYLPSELLPEDWQGDICEKRFVELGGKGFLAALFERII